MYSQHDEEGIIADYFGTFVGTLLSLGENDGTSLSNTRRLLEKGWGGVLVEPSDVAFTKLKTAYQNHPNVQCIKVAVGVQDAIVELHVNDSHLGKGDTGLLSTLLTTERDRWGNTETFHVERVRCVTFKTLLQMSTVTKFDLISIDIEGMDYDVLRQMNLKELGCRMLVVEYNWKDEGKYTDYVSQFGYILIAKNPGNLIYVTQ
jgi:FkbM family methyltransferase